MKSSCRCVLIALSVMMMMLILVLFVQSPTRAEFFVQSDGLEARSPYITVEDKLIISVQSKLNLESQALVASEHLLSTSSYFGGGGIDHVSSALLDSKERLIIGGETTSSDFPLKNPFNDTFGGSTDSYIAKFESNFSLVWSTYFGGSSSEKIESIATDSADNIIVVGKTSSFDFPTVNASDDTKDGTWDAFIAKFSENGSLLWSTYLGGTGNEQETSVAVDQSDNIFVAGVTYSTDFPLSNAYNSTFGGVTDVYVAKFSPSGVMLWSTFFGGNDGDYVHDATIDSSGNFIIVGVTLSTDFPVIRSVSPFNPGGFDAFILKFASTGDVVFSGVFGGSSSDFVDSVTVDENDNIYVSGSTASDNFPVSFFSLFNTYGGGTLDGFSLYFSPKGSLLWSAYLGGVDTDIASTLIFNDDGDLLVAGSTKSVNFPVLNGYDMMQEGQGNNDAFLLKLSDNQLQWGTFFGGTKEDVAKAALATADGQIIVVGKTESDDLPLKQAFDSTLDGTDDVFLAKFFDSDGDYDQDGLNNYLEGHVGTNLTKSDTDNDGMPDGWEYQMGLDPLTPAGDQDDFDADGMPDIWEYQMELNASNPSDATEDADSDDLSNAKEYFLGLDARDPDTDDDFLLDGEEVMTTFTEANNTDTDGDTLADGLEVLFYHTNPLKADTDADGISDSQEVLNGTDPLDPNSSSSNDGNSSSNSNNNATQDNATNADDNQVESDTPSQQSLTDTVIGYLPLVGIGVLALAVGLMIGRKIGMK